MALLVCVVLNRVLVLDLVGEGEGEGEGEGVEGVERMSCAIHYQCCGNLLQGDLIR